MVHIWQSKLVFHSVYTDVKQGSAPLPINVSDYVTGGSSPTRGPYGWPLPSAMPWRWQLLSLVWHHDVTTGRDAVCITSGLLQQLSESLEWTEGIDYTPAYNPDLLTPSQPAYISQPAYSLPTFTFWIPDGNHISIENNLCFLVSAIWIIS